MTTYLLLPSERYIEFPFWCLVRLFDETVKNNDLSSDHGAEKRSSNSFFALARISKRPLPIARVCGIPKLGPYSSMRTSMLEIEHASQQAKHQAPPRHFHCNMKVGKP
jgi:hypothetical protein